MYRLNGKKHLKKYPYYENKSLIGSTPGKRKRLNLFFILMIYINLNQYTSIDQSINEGHSQSIWSKLPPLLNFCCI